MKASIRNKLVECSKRKHFAIRLEEHAPHVLAPYSKPASIYTGHYLETRLPLSQSIIAHFGEVDDARHLISRRAIVACDFRFDEHSRVILIRHKEVGSLIVPRNTLGAFCFPETDACPAQAIFDGALHYIADEFRDGIPMAGKRTAKKPFIQQHSVGYVLCRDIF